MTDKRSIIETGRSQRGASLPLALLLFLICTMVVAVVLSAVTMASGRSSNLTENDQAYYSAVSAVNVFRDELMGDEGKGHSVTVAVKASTGSGSSTTYQLLMVADGTAVDGDFGLLERAAMYLLFGRNASDIDSAQSAAAAAFSTASAWSTWPNAGSFHSGRIGSYELAHTSTALNSAEKEALKVNVDASINGEGALVLSFRKAGADGAEDDMALFNLTCDLDYESGIVEEPGTGTGSVIKYATITWVPSNLEKG